MTKCAIFDDSVTHKKRDFMNPMQDSRNTTREMENSAKRGKVGMSDNYIFSSTFQQCGRLLMYLLTVLKHDVQGGPD